MIISLLKLVNFRNYKKRDFDFGIKNVVAGNNGTGKTNILEAIYMLATGKSFRADTDHELVRYNENLSIISCQLSINSDVTSLQVSLFDHKRFEVNGVAKRMVDFAGRLKAVLFGPTDMEIITGSPSRRRKYLDFVISQNDREYRRTLMSYEKGLRQRNKLLDLIRDGKADRHQLWFWDKLLIKDGNYLTKMRDEYTGRFNKQNRNYVIHYDKSLISEERLKKYEVEEVAAGTTLVGPHRDDFVVLSDEKDISKFGSRGQQRMAILALKMWELQYLTTEELPVLLLDDVFSELDHGHREEVLKLALLHAAEGGQVIMTTADEHLVPKDKDWNIIKL